MAGGEQDAPPRCCGRSCDRGRRTPRRGRRDHLPGRTGPAQRGEHRLAGGGRRIADVRPGRWLRLCGPGLRLECGDVRQRRLVLLHRSGHRRGGRERDPDVRRPSHERIPARGRGIPGEDDRRAAGLRPARVHPAAQDLGARRHLRAGVRLEHHAGRRDRHRERRGRRPELRPSAGLGGRLRGRPQPVRLPQRPDGRAQGDDDDTRALPAGDARDVERFRHGHGPDQPTRVDEQHGLARHRRLLGSLRLHHAARHRPQHGGPGSAQRGLDRPVAGVRVLHVRLG